LSRSKLRWGVLGAAGIADHAVLPALKADPGSRVVAIASRDRGRAEAMARRHDLERVHDGYAELLDDPDLDAVYLPLANSLHLEWTLSALAAGKHVLCEKPLALDEAEGEQMAAAAEDADRLLMEAFMYRFHPRIRKLVDSVASTPIRHLYATFGFTLRAPGNYRLLPELGGGALLDTGCYVASVAGWLLGEPLEVQALIRRKVVDMSCSALLSFPGGAQASLYCSFESPEYQELVVVCEDRVIRLEEPFTAWRQPDDPYRLMVEAFRKAALSGDPSPLPLADSLANLRLLDRIRAAAR
jgi:D-xylose 1-dehydrogenase (NADP+, D-xylono-1,5-lactone-forming)